MTKAVEAGLANAQLASFHESYRLLQRHYSYEHANLSSFLNSLLVQISLAALTKGEKPQQEAYLSGLHCHVHGIYSRASWREPAAST